MAVAGEDEPAGQRSGRWRQKGDKAVRLGLRGKRGSGRCARSCRSRVPLGLSQREAQVAVRWKVAEEVGGGRWRSGRERRREAEG